MPSHVQICPNLRLHLTNVAGTGASQLLLSLLPALERNVLVKITEIHLPDRGNLANYKKSHESGMSKRYRRRLPNGLSRILECMVFARNFDGDTPLLVLGDLPLRCNAPQVVFVQTSLLLKPERFAWSFGSLKFAISRLVFRLNVKYADAFIVQTGLMKTALAASYPAIINKIHVIAQPVPAWLLKTAIRRCGLHGKAGRALKLFYPADGYTHKNHKLLASIKQDLGISWPVESLKLTLPVENHPAPNVPWIHCVGFLSSSEMIQAYNEVDGLLFLSLDESYGFPLVEAMFMGLPIVCPDLPYANALCADGAIYFNPHSIDSLRVAVEILHTRLSVGWWPDWSMQLSEIPKNWDVVADAMIALACSSSLSSASL
jgi:glycosyltransferase involved in cell wall biosynthesis